jgi:hypothetical protein
VEPMTGGAAGADAHGARGAVGVVFDARPAQGTSVNGIMVGSATVVPAPDGAGCEGARVKVAFNDGKVQ